MQTEPKLSARDDAQTPNTETTCHPTIYQVRVQGHLDRQWMDWFSGLTVTLDENGETLLTGAVVDQAALYGVLKRVRDLGMPLVSVLRVPCDTRDPMGCQSHTEGLSDESKSILVQGAKREND